MAKQIAEYNGIKSASFVERDGKYVLEFDDIPSLLFVSFDGNGTDDHTEVTINSAVNTLTTYNTKRYAMTFKD